MKRPSLIRAIDQRINLGRRSPREIAASISSEDEMWQREALWEMRFEIYHAYARRGLGGIRRQRDRAARQADRSAQTASERSRIQLREWILSSEYVGGGEWKRRADLSADECDFVAREAEQAANALWSKGQTARTWAAMIREQGVETLGEVEGDIPTPPGEEDERAA